ncbi:MAG TPA: hypothetical protein VFA04_22120 [Bryobacteraceae bacterium]|nr:hypothetical protein [Bryobacteraceae bacterium]
MNIRLLLTAALIAAGLHAGDAATAFERMKSLAGEWEGNTKTGKAHLTWEVVSGGNAVLERESADGMPTMITVYYVDGDRLLLTHYCMAGNEPRIQARHFDPATGELKFEFLDAANLASPRDGHMHDATLRLIDHDHVASAWEFYQDGKPKFSESFEYTRIH